MMAAAPSAGPALRDIHAAAVPSWWPPAPGWWLLAGIVSVIVWFVSRKVYRKFAQRKARRRLLTEFDDAVADSKGNRAQLAATLSVLLRRGQLRHASSAAALTGAAWLAHLDRQTGGDEFASGVGSVLVDAPYRRDSTYDASALIALARRATLAAFDAGERSRV